MARPPNKGMKLTKLSAAPLRGRSAASCPRRSTAWTRAPLRSYPRCSTYRKSGRISWIAIAEGGSVAFDPQSGSGGRGGGRSRDRVCCSLRACRCDFSSRCSSKRDQVERRVRLPRWLRPCDARGRGRQGSSVHLPGTPTCRLHVPAPHTRGGRACDRPPGCLGLWCRRHLRCISPEVVPSWIVRSHSGRHTALRWYRKRHSHSGAWNRPYRVPICGPWQRTSALTGPPNKQTSVEHTGRSHPRCSADVRKSRRRNMAGAVRKRMVEADVS